MRKAAKISPLSSRKIDRYEYLAGEEVLPVDQSRVIKQANFKFAFQKEIKTIEDQGEKQTKPLKEHGKQLVELNALVKNDYDSKTETK